MITPSYSHYNFASSLMTSNKTTSLSFHWLPRRDQWTGSSSECRQMDQTWSNEDQALNYPSPLLLNVFYIFQLLLQQKSRPNYHKNCGEDKLLTDRSFRGVICIYSCYVPLQPLLTRCLYCEIPCSV